MSLSSRSTRPTDRRAGADGSTAPPDNDVLRAHGLTLTQGSRTLLRDVSAAVRADETFAITGPDGAGKSALLACLSGVLAPDAGEIWFNSGPLHVLDEKGRTALRRRHFGLVDGRTRLLPELTVAENVALPLLLDRTRRTEAFAIARHWMERLDVTEHAEARPPGLGPALLRRAAVARALVTRPAVVFADEPAHGLAGAELDHLMRILVSAVRSHGITLVLATADRRVAAHADRGLVLREGRPDPRAEGW
ncbi:ABC transporter ATP-binding protein [Embleya hyalina]|uniref:ABC transporter ATP-binding protein n=1 Tax=Embleya hyalina TaxID=516124 RepID=A0A401YPA3_9ACTN|nr:ATP-binding cassette domain-containing protein [Embleya hyalina]GCD96426.1 ABC transporter ATP-binding protein [Embleya hyalina]